MTKVSLIKSHLCAIKGMYYGFSKQRNIKLQLILGIILVSLAIYFNQSLLETLMIAILSCTIIILELFNTVIEKLCDKIELNNDKDIELIKDMSAGAVLISAILALVISIIILIL